MYKKVINSLQRKALKVLSQHKVKIELVILTYIHKQTRIRQNIRLSYCQRILNMNFCIGTRKPKSGSLINSSFYSTLRIINIGGAQAFIKCEK